MKIISPEDLASLMEDRDQSVRDLADAVSMKLKRRGLACGKSTIANLRNGTQTRTKRQIAHAIEDILMVPRGTLFIPELSSVPQDRRQLVA